ncbi:DUF4375 domain-containing protein [Haloferula chungangensis]|uniref:DUF4375 domain-containing protein n=1 Tax=Haloferula chungangensis TaxID=1048331 RepID=A0ABW2LEV8_9BACT
MPYSLELTIDAGGRTTEIVRAVKAFDRNLVMGTVLNLLRERKALVIALDGKNRVEVLRRLSKLLEELTRLQTEYQLLANNVPRSSHLWEPQNWNLPDILKELSAAEEAAEDRKRAEEVMRDYVPPEPPPSRKLFDQRWRDVAFPSLFSSEQQYLYIWSLVAEVNNGGFAVYFDNSSGDDALQALTALESIGSEEVIDVLSDAIALVERDGEYPIVREERWAAVQALPDDAFTQLNNRFYDRTEDPAEIAFQLVESEYQTKRML